MAMFSGIMFARIAGGLIATHLGWRYSYMMSAGMLLLIIPVLWARLPNTRHLAGVVSRSDVVDLPAVAHAWRHPARRGDTVHVRHLLRRILGGRRPMLAVLHSVGPSGAGFMGIPGAAGIFVARPAGAGWTVPE